MTDFPIRLKKLREEKGVKRYILAECCGLHSDAIRRYERGEQEPELSSAIAIADFFEVSLDYLAGRATEKNFQNSTFKGKNQKDV